MPERINPRTGGKEVWWEARPVDVLTPVVEELVRRRDAKKAATDEHTDKQRKVHKPVSLLDHLAQPQRVFRPVTPPGPST